MSGWMMLWSCSRKDEKWMERIRVYVVDIMSFVFSSSFVTVVEA